MNNDTLSQIFASYIENFQYVNSGDRIEYYKWQICYKFKQLMDEAIAAPTHEFSKALMKAKVCSSNIIDSFTSPFYGLVKFAEEEPETVRQMFIDLYAEDNGDLSLQMKKIQAFFDKSNELLEKYSPGSYLYKQNSHSVSAYLFLYDPDNHYMYKAQECKTMADCIGFYDDWGSGDNIKLDVFYRMCDEILVEINKCSELLDTNESRYDGRLKINPGELHSDNNKHILLFDIIWVCMAYKIFDAIPYMKPTTKERKLYVENKEKAEKLKAAYDNAKERMNQLDEALEYFTTAVKSGDSVYHKKYKECVITQINSKYIHIVAKDNEEELKLSLPVVIANGIIKYDVIDFDEKLLKYKTVLQKVQSIPTLLDSAARELEPYEKYLD